MVIGRITKPHGVTGELRVAVYTDVPERFAWLETVYVSADMWDETPRPVAVTAVRPHGSLMLVKLDGITSRESAEALRGQWLQIPADEAVPLEAGEFYLYQLMGMAVVTEDGETLGVVGDLIDTGANLVFVVNGDGGDLLLPDIDDVVLGIDGAARQITVRLLPGLR